MKGNNIYIKAQQIHEKMYQLRESLNQKQRKNLYEKYLLIIRKAAYLGNAEAQYDLAQQYEDTNYLHDQNPNYDPKKCIYWYTKASKQNHAAAYNNLAHFYELGIGCEKDLKLVLELYKKSADLGYDLGKKNYKLMVKQMSK